MSAPDVILLILICSVPFLLGYLLGSIPFGLILTRMFGVGDIRNIGSGNIGATNVLRTGRKGLAAATLLLDMGKGAVLVLLIGWSNTLPRNSDALSALVGHQVQLAAALAALIGHCYPIWLKFRGGKGVATMLGVSFALAWPIGLISALVWLGGMFATRISSVGGMASAVAAPIVAFAIGQYEMAAVLALMAAIVIWKHRANVARLRAGTEPRIGAKS
jgi:glycerol-3-phosphate acyltransferase PlsY